MQNLALLCLSLSLAPCATQAHSLTYCLLTESGYDLIGHCDNMSAAIRCKGEFDLWAARNPNEIFSLGPLEPANDCAATLAACTDGGAKIEIRELVSGETHEINPSRPCVVIRGRTDALDEAAEGDTIEEAIESARSQGAEGLIRSTVGEWSRRWPDCPAVVRDGETGSRHWWISEIVSVATVFAEVHPQQTIFAEIHDNQTRLVQIDGLIWLVYPSDPSACPDPEECGEHCGCGVITDLIYSSAVWESDGGPEGEIDGDGDAAWYPGGSWSKIEKAGSIEEAREFVRRWKEQIAEEQKDALDAAESEGF